MRIALGLDYLGTKFHGWQSQANVSTLQQSLEQALSKVANHSIQVVCAGRTDAGVHASHQVVHFETDATRSITGWVMGTNSYLPQAISVQWGKFVAADFHARFSALSRQYQYYIYNNPVRSSLFGATTTWVYQDLDVVAMHEAAQYLLGEHDFTSFRSAECQSRTANRYVFAIDVTRNNDLIKIEITANSFLHHMVRNIVGVLIEIGKGRQKTAWCQEVLLAKDRRRAARTAPAQGLYLVGVCYPDGFELPSQFRQPFFIQ